MSTTRESVSEQQLRRLRDEAAIEVRAISELIALEAKLTTGALPSADSDLHTRLEILLAGVHTRLAALAIPATRIRPFATIADNMEQSIAATENAWRELENECGLLSSLEVSALLGSKSPNRSFASEQRSKGKLIAVKRPGGLRYPGFQFDVREQTIRPIMAELISVAGEAGRSEASLALWMSLPTGYLDGDCPVDHLSNPQEVVEAARQSFNVQG